MTTATAAARSAAHDYALYVVRAWLAESDDPEPEPVP